MNGVSEANWFKTNLLPQDSGSDGENCVVIEEGRIVQGRVERQGDVMAAGSSIRIVAVLGQVGIGNGTECHAAGLDRVDGKVAA